MNTLQTGVKETAKRPIFLIAHEIRKDWGAKINYAAKPYLEAMECLVDMSSMYGADNARSCIAYFLCNATTWRGEVARRVKKELNDLIKY